MAEIFFLAMDLGNDAFGHQPDRAATADDMRPEVVRILKNLADRVEAGGPIQTDGSYRLIDSNGNTVGYAGVKEDGPRRSPLIWEGLARLVDGE
jgi:hypothetical protein